MGINIAVDAMGGDNAPFEIVKGCIEAVNEDKDNIIISLVGNEDIIKKELQKYSYNKDKIKVVNATEIIETCDVPTIAIKKKKDSSMVVGLNLLKEEKAEAFISAGNTGALLTGATVKIGRIKGIERPALGTLLPNEKGGASFLIDSGANVDSKASYIEQFAKMGSVYMENIIGIKNPKVGLVNIGAEKEKGNMLTKEAYELLENSDINFIGNIEARDIPLGLADVVVCDAFVGNVILKFAEGLGKMLLNMIKKELMSGLITKIGAFLSLKAFKRLKKNLDYAEIGGAPFLGLKALVVKAHGSSDSKAIKNAVLQCKIFIEKDIVNKIQEKI